MKLLFLAFGINLIVTAILCQSSFEIKFNSPNQDFGISSFEAGGYYYSLGGQLDSNDFQKALVCRFNNDNDLLVKQIIKQDTHFMYSFGIDKYNSILLIGRIVDTLYHYLCVAEFTYDLELVSEKYYNIIPSGYDYFTPYDMVINQEGNIVLAGHMDDFPSSTIQGFMMVELDIEGNLINYNHYTNNSFDGEEGADLVVKSDGTGYYYFNCGNYDWIELDNDLEFIMGGYGLEVGGLATCRYLSDGNFLFISTRSNLNYFYDLQLIQYNPSFQALKDTIIIEEGRQWAARFKGMDFIDENIIWVATHDCWASPYGTEIYQIYIFDSDFNVIGNKYLGGDTQYDFRYVTATSDGGCIITGTTNQEQGSLYQDIFIKKVMPDDIITGTDEKVFSEFKDVFVYPNPVSDKIYLKTERENLSLILYGANGNVLYKDWIRPHQQSEINISWLPKGFYIYSIINESGKAIDGGKLLKQ